jgi:hypothetical protein
MTIARPVADVLADHMVLEYESIDRMYLNVYVPHLQTVGGMLGYLRVHRGKRLPMTEAFVRNIERFVASEGVVLITFEKGQRKDDVTQGYLRKIKKKEGVLYVGKAQKKARVNCSYFLYNTKLCINGHEYLKRQLAKGGWRSRPSTTASSRVPIPNCCRD